MSDSFIGHSGNREEESKNNKRSSNSNPLRLSRRNFLLTSAIAGVSVSFGMTFPGQTFAATQEDSASFAKLSAFVTGRKNFNPDLVTRAYGQLMALDPNFGTKLNALGAAIAKSGAKSIDAFLATNPDKDIRDTMTTITGVWYLGYTGTPDPSQETDNAKFVTYRGALMWEPTSDATPIPTYSQHTHNYWANPPASIAND